VVVGVTLQVTQGGKGEGDKCGKTQNQSEFVIFVN